MKVYRKTSKNPKRIQKKVGTDTVQQQSQYTYQRPFPESICQLLAKETLNVVAQLARDVILAVFIGTDFLDASVVVPRTFHPRVPSSVSLP